MITLYLIFSNTFSYYLDIVCYPDSKTKKCHLKVKTIKGDH